MKAKHKTDAMATAKRLAPFCLCGARTSLKYLHVLIAEMDGVRRVEDSECVHRMRVALRRLRSVLPLFTACLSRQTCDRWRKQLRRLTRPLGSARDMDVQLACVQQVLDTGASEIERAGLERVLLRLRQRRHTLQEPVAEALNRFAASDLMAEMEHTLMQLARTNQAQEGEMPGRSVYRKMRKAILTRLKALQEYAPYVHRPECLKELHALRIAAKRLRYTMQAFAPLYQVEIEEPMHAARTLQTLLGDMHDCDVWAHDLPQFLEEERARTLEYFGQVEPFAPLSTWTEILTCFERGSPVGIAGDSSEKMYKNLRPGT
jgi:CHAD domain-containing protein